MSLLALEDDGDTSIGLEGEDTELDTLSDETVMGDSAYGGPETAREDGCPVILTEDPGPGTLMGDPEVPEDEEDSIVPNVVFNDDSAPIPPVQRLVDVGLQDWRGLTNMPFHTNSVA